MRRLVRMTACLLLCLFLAASEPMAIFASEIPGGNGDVTQTGGNEGNEGNEGTDEGGSTGEGEGSEGSGTGETTPPAPPVTPATPTVTLNATEKTLAIGKSVKLTAKVNGGTQGVTWTSGKNSVATVSADGTVKALAQGVSVITATCRADKSVKVTCKITVPKRRYTRASGYYQFQTEVKLPSGGYNLSRKNIGLKVMKVNAKVGGLSGARYSVLTKYKVKRFQKKKKLPVTGVVNLKTWKAMGYSEYSWYNLGTYRTPIKVDGNSSKQDYIDAMIKTASEYASKKTKYRVGCSGTPGTAVDCSGLIFQCLYSIGINPKKNIVDHALAKYEYTSRNLAADPKLGKRVSVRNMKRGDLIFFGKRVYHVAIYAGNGYMYDSWPILGVRKRRFSGNASKGRISKVVRVIY